MGIYQKVCYVVEDMFVKALSKSQNREEVKERVRIYRDRMEVYKQRKKQEKKGNTA